MVLADPTHMHHITQKHIRSSPSSVGVAWAIFPTSSSACISFLIRAAKGHGFLACRIVGLTCSSYMCVCVCACVCVCVCARVCVHVHLHRHMHSASKFHATNFCTEFRSVQKCSEEFRSVQKSSEVFRSVQKSSEEFRRVQKSSEVYRRVQKCSEVCVCIAYCVCVFPVPCVCTEFNHAQ